MRTDQKMVAYYVKKMRFLILKTLNELLLTQNFQRHILRKTFDLKIKEINMKTKKHKK